MTAVILLVGIDGGPQKSVALINVMCGALTDSLVGVNGLMEMVT